MAQIIELNDSSFQTEVLESETPVLVDFWAVWCGPCRMIAPVFEELAEEYAGKVKFAKVNVDEVSEVVGRYGIMSIPTIMLFEGGNPVETLVGVQPKERYVELLDEAIS